MFKARPSSSETRSDAFSVYDDDDDRRIDVEIMMLLKYFNKPSSQKSSADELYNLFRIRIDKQQFAETKWITNKPLSLS
jgi:hypothetical protein